MWNFIVLIETIMNVNTFLIITPNFISVLLLPQIQHLSMTLLFLESFITLNNTASFQIAPEGWG